MKTPREIIETALERILPAGWERSLRQYELRDIGDAVSALERRYEQLLPASEYHEDMGSVLWWHLPVCEPPIVGVIDDYEASNGWLTHFSRMPIVWAGDGQPKHPISGGSE